MLKASVILSICDFRRKKYYAMLHSHAGTNTTKFCNQILNNNYYKISCDVDFKFYLLFSCSVNWNRVYILVPVELGLSSCILIDGPQTSLPIQRPRTPTNEMKL